MQLADQLREAIKGGPGDFFERLRCRLLPVQICVPIKNPSAHAAAQLSTTFPAFPAALPSRMKGSTWASRTPGPRSLHTLGLRPATGSPQPELKGRLKMVVQEPGTLTKRLWTANFRTMSHEASQHPRFSESLQIIHERNFTFDSSSYAVLT